MPHHDKNYRPKAISLFSGCGGMDLGFSLEGYDVVWANDHFHDACETYRRNFGDHIIEDDIENINFDNVPDCDIILGGFPCQDFSVIWKQEGIKTQRGNLYKFFVNAVAAKNPKVFVAENVKGILTANNGKAIKQIVGDFSNCGKFGYHIYMDAYNFADYGAPQLRRRVLIIGIRKDIGYIFRKPKPTNGPNNYVTAGEALKGVEKAPHNNELMPIRERTKKILEMIPEGGNFTSIPKASEYYVNGMISHVYRRLHKNKPSTTIIAGGGGGTWGYHYSEPRPLTNRERARLFGYPDDFVFVGTFATIRKQIGNSVPPVAIRKFAKELMKVFTGDFSENEKLQVETPQTIKIRVSTKGTKMLRAKEPSAHLQHTLQITEEV